MSDITLLAIGCGVTFMTLAGSYLFLRERFNAGTRQFEVDSEKAKSEAQDARRAA